MNGKQVKLLRSQIRNVVQEILPEVMAGELYVKLQKETAERLDLVTSEVRDTLKQLDARSKSVQDYIMRQVEAAQAPQTAPAVDEVKSTRLMRRAAKWFLRSKR